MMKNRVPRFVIVPEASEKSDIFVIVGFLRAIHVPEVLRVEFQSSLKISRIKVCLRIQFRRKVVKPAEQKSFSAVTEDN